MHWAMGGPSPRSCRIGFFCCRTSTRVPSLVFHDAGSQYRCRLNDRCCWTRLCQWIECVVVGWVSRYRFYGPRFLGWSAHATTFVKAPISYVGRLPRIPVWRWHTHNYHVTNVLWNPCVVSGTANRHRMGPKRYHWD